MGITYSESAITWESKRRAVSRVGEFCDAAIIPSFFSHFLICNEVHHAPFREAIELLEGRGPQALVSEQHLNARNFTALLSLLFSPLFDVMPAAKEICCWWRFIASHIA